MATLPVEEPRVTVDEYLQTSYRPDCDYVGGRIEERNVGEKEHSLIQRYLTFLFMLKREAWAVEGYPELRMRVSAMEFRVPHLVVVRAGEKFERVLERPPLIAIEILSPEDRLSRFQHRIDDYLNFGIEHIWIFDPERRAAWTATRDGLHLVQSGELGVAGTAIRLVLSEVFAELDQA
jgi:Uma2 family endonuclease